MNSGFRVYEFLLRKGSAGVKRSEIVVLKNHYSKILTKSEVLL